MEAQVSKTPYNSIYEPLQGKKARQELCCCLHGRECAYGRGINTNRTDTADSSKSKSEDNQYVNLTSPSAEEKLAIQLANKLSKLSHDERLSKNGKVEIASIDSLLKAKEKLSDDRKPKRPASTRKKVSSTIDENSYVMLGQSNKNGDGASLSIPPPPPPPPPPPATIEDQIPSEMSQSILNNNGGGLEAVEMGKKANDKNLLATAMSYSSVASSIYLGVVLPNDAEAQVKKIHDFCLYHKLAQKCQLCYLTDGLPLMLVYKLSNSKYRHYPICMTSIHGDIQFFVDNGRPNVRKHYSLNQLVKYYQDKSELGDKEEDQ